MESPLDGGQTGRLYPLGSLGRLAVGVLGRGSDSYPKSVGLVRPCHDHADAVVVSLILEAVKPDTHADIENGRFPLRRLPRRWLELFLWPLVSVAVALAGIVGRAACCGSNLDGNSSFISGGCLVLHLHLRRFGLDGKFGLNLGIQIPI